LVEQCFRKAKVPGSNPGGGSKEWYTENLMKPEQIPAQDGQSEPQIPQQMNFDFKEAAVRARAIELQKEHGWMLSYAMDNARIEFARKKWEEQSKQKEKSN
jgi:hypothetical protein